MKRILAALIAAYLLCGALVGCSAETPPKTEAETEAKSSATNEFADGTQKYENFGISCDIPKSWEKTDLDNGNDYFYPQVENGTAFFMATYSGMSASILDETRMDDFAVGLEKSFTSVTRLKCEEAENKLGHKYAAIDLEGEMNGSTGRLYNAIFDAPEGVAAIGLFQQDTCDKDFYEDFMRIVDTVQVDEEQLSVPSVDENTEADGEQQADLSELLEGLRGCVGADEEISGAKIDGRVLTVTVDFSRTDFNILSAEDLALSRASSITDEILNHGELDAEWDMILIDFGTTGKIEIGKDAIKSNDYGMRYMDSARFILK